TLRLPCCTLFPYTTLFRSQADVGLLIAGLLLVGLVTPLQAWRWLMLMRCRGLDPGYLKSLRLNLVGLFFNFCMPGMTGGDLIKRSEEHTSELQSRENLVCR